MSSPNKIHHPKVTNQNTKSTGQKLTDKITGTDFENVTPQANAKPHNYSKPRNKKET